MDQVHQPLQSLLPWHEFSVRIPESKIDRVPEILLSIPEKRVQQMKAKVRRVMHRFVYLTHPLLKDKFLALRKTWAEKRAAEGQGSGSDTESWFNEGTLNSAGYGSYDDEEEDNLHNWAAAAAAAFAGDSISPAAASSDATPTSAGGDANDPAGKGRRELLTDIVSGGLGAPIAWSSDVVSATSDDAEKSRIAAAVVGSKQDMSKPQWEFIPIKGDGSNAQEVQGLVSETPTHHPPPASSAAHYSPSDADAAWGASLMEAKVRAHGEALGVTSSSRQVLVEENVATGISHHHTEQQLRGLGGLPLHFIEDDMFGTIIQWLYVKMLDGYQ
jgi:hypothetical protein